METSETYKVYTKPNCPWGKKAISLLEDKKLEFDLIEFQSDDEIEKFKEKYQVSTTPQIFKNGNRIGGYTDLANDLGEDREASKQNDDKSYKPVIAVFGVAAIISFAISGDISTFMGMSLSLLAMLKLMDLQSFKTSFSNYDLITKKIPPYGYVYPFLELLSGIGFLMGTFPKVAGAVALFAGLTGGLSVVKAVYIDKLDLNCACVGGHTNVPLGFISFTENAFMAVMGGYLLFT